VTLGLRGLALTEITRGLQPGDWILADAKAPVEEGSRARVRAVSVPADAADPATSNELPAKLD
jgi:HlyD family secretion protein